jgi:sortase A
MASGSARAARSLSWQAALLLPFAAGFLGAFISISVSSNASALASAGKSTLVATTTTKTAVAAIPVVRHGIAVNEPARLIIPSIGVNASVQSVGLSKTGSGAIGTPSNFTDVAWYNRSPVPGDSGIAIIDGHLDGRTVPEAVFYHLADLTEGQNIYVQDRAGVQQRFIVTGRQVLPNDADTSSIFARTDTPQLVLITCTGDWIPEKHEYSDRVVVFATRE